MLVKTTVIRGIVIIPTQVVNIYQVGESSSEYCPTPLKKARFNPISLGNSLFICQTSQVQSFID